MKSTPKRARISGKRTGPKPVREETVLERREREARLPVVKTPQIVASERPLVDADTEGKALLGQFAKSVQEFKRHRTAMESSEERAVRLGREAGRSWDRIGDVMGVPGETLRRRYAGRS